MSDILDDYRVRQASRPDRVQTHYIGCHMHHDECMTARMAAEIASLRDEVERLRLTDAERGAIQTAIDILTDPVCRTENKQTETLRALLARLGGER